VPPSTAVTLPSASCSCFMRAFYLYLNFITDGIDEIDHPRVRGRPPFARKKRRMGHPECIGRSKGCATRRSRSLNPESIANQPNAIQIVDTLKPL